jgi:purine nucleosidase
VAKVVVDTDPGTDDALALIMALSSPELDVQGLTTVGGNARLADTTRNTLALMSYLGRPDTPVARGASRPMKGSFHYGYYYHGPGGLTVSLPKAKAGPSRLRAADYLISIGHSFRSELLLVALGPLTNVARALQREPRLAAWVREIVVMGGAVEVAGNVTPYAEFNIYNDPHAANIVFGSGVPVTLVGLDVCLQVAFERDERAWLDGNSVGERLAARILNGWFNAHPDQHRFSLCDPLAMAAAIEPDLLETEAATVVVETEDTTRYGQTRAQYGGGPVKVARRVDVERARALILERIGTG